MGEWYNDISHSIAASIIINIMPFQLQYFNIALHLFSNWLSLCYRENEYFQGYYILLKRSNITTYVDPIQRKKSTIYTASYLEDLDCFYLKEHGRKKTGYLFLHATEAERKKTKGCITQLHNNECGFITQPAIFNIKSNSANA